MEDFNRDGREDKNVEETYIRRHERGEWHREKKKDRKGVENPPSFNKKTNVRDKMCRNDTTETLITEVIKGRRVDTNGVGKFAKG